MSATRAVKSRPSCDVAQVVAGAVRADDVRALARTVGSSHDLAQRARRARRRRRSSRDRRRTPRGSRPAGPARYGAPSAFDSFSSCRRWSPRTSASTTPPLLVLRHDDDRLHGQAARRCRGTRASAAMVRDARRLDLLERRLRRRTSAGARHRDGDLDVGGVVAAVAEHDAVLARPATAPCTRAPRSRPSCRRRTRPCTSRSPAAVEDARVGDLVLARSPRRGPRRSRSSVYESFMMNSRVRSRPPCGRGSSRSLVCWWYQICGRSR